MSAGTHHHVMSAPLQRAFFVVLVVVRHQGRYLMIQETKHGQRWYLPAGGVEEGESPTDGARRETLEEAGIAIEPTVFLDVEHFVRTGPSVVLRFIVAAKARSFEPKQTPDEHSLRASWLTRDEIESLPLRDPEVLRHIDSYERLFPPGEAATMQVA